jgi:uncharacterized membrane protein (DUF373 family)
MSSSPSPARDHRTWIARCFTWVEDIVYIGLGLLLACYAFYLLVTAAHEFASSILAVLRDSGTVKMVELLDKTLLVLLVVELLYTVQVSFREHALVPEPFLLVGIISAIRRVLVVTAEFKELQEKGLNFQNFAIELAVLTVLILVLVISLVLLRRRETDHVAQR